MIICIEIAEMLSMIFDHHVALQGVLQGATIVVAKEKWSQSEVRLQLHSFLRIKTSKI